MAIIERRRELMGKYVTMYDWGKYSLNCTEKTYEDGQLSSYYQTNINVQYVGAMGGRWPIFYSKTQPTLDTSTYKYTASTVVSADTCWFANATLNYIGTFGTNGGKLTTYYIPLGIDSNGTYDAYCYVHVSDTWSSSALDVTLYTSQLPSSGNATVDVNVLPSSMSGVEYYTLTIPEFSQGTYISNVSSLDSSAYPSNGKSGSYWYVYLGSHKEPA